MSNTKCGLIAHFLRSHGLNAALSEQLAWITTDDGKDTAAVCVTFTQLRCGRFFPWPQSLYQSQVSLPDSNTISSKLGILTDHGHPKPVQFNTDAPLSRETLMNPAKHILLWIW
jgi:hypothetical protein